ncbi:hypothetical protein KIPB_013167 [Kipferlia bialata]|uniref:Secreted protein n=1 Tax=Kipferlia bialata TaxID=797122 RepID=A0A391NU60_9EUKA|nr:hypothetical protein KIPB_013167 [Kipferlia bialata]|eukprot:g13167.t1
MPLGVHWTWCLVCALVIGTVCADRAPLAKSTSFDGDILLRSQADRVAVPTEQSFSRPSSPTRERDVPIAPPTGLSDANMAHESAYGVKDVSEDSETGTAREICDATCLSESDACDEGCQEAYRRYTHTHTHTHTDILVS